MPQYKRKLKKGLRWYYKFDYQGRTYHSEAIYLTKQEAAKAEREKREEAEYQSGSRIKNKEITLLELINERLDYLKAAKTEKYYEESKFYFKKLFEYLGNIPVVDIEKSKMQKFLVEQSLHQKSRGNDNYAVNAMIRSYKALFTHGIKILEMPISNPCLGISFFPVKEHIKYIPTDEEIEKVLKQCNDRQRLLIEFVRDTGCRISEALNLRRRDVFKGYVILYTRKSKSGNLRPREAKFDTSKFEMPINQEERVFKEWKDAPRFLLNKTNGKWNWHNLRHRFASKLSQSNTPIFEIMCLLGHSNLETTQNYLQLLPKS